MSNDNNKDLMDLNNLADILLGSADSSGENESYEEQYNHQMNSENLEDSEELAAREAAIDQVNEQSEDQESYQENPSRVKEIIDSYIPGPEPRIPASFFQDQEMYVMKACLQSNRRGVEVILKMAEYFDERLDRDKRDAKSDRAAFLVELKNCLKSHNDISENLVDQIKTMLDPNQPKSPAANLRALGVQYLESSFVQLDSKGEEVSKQVEDVGNKKIGFIATQAGELNTSKVDVTKAVETLSGLADKLKFENDRSENLKSSAKPGFWTRVGYVFNPQ